MISFLFTKKNAAIALVAIVFVTSVVSASIFIAPSPAHALFGVGDIDFDPTNFFENTLSAIFGEDADIAADESAVAQADMAADEESMWIKEYVLDPVAWGVAQGVLQGVTGSIVKVISNGAKGGPMIVTNLQGHLQGVGDSQTSAFLLQFAANSKSPFAASISSSLRTNYIQNTSLAGFWAANQCTLSKSSPDINKFLAGNYSQGGTKAWFALTTQDQNNPYALYQNSQAQLGNVVSGAQSARSAQINQGGGFLPMCNSNSTNSGRNGINIQDFCTNTNGSSGSVQTPGSIVMSSLNKSLGSGIDKMANADEISEMLASIAASLVSNVVSTGIISMTQTSSSRSGLSTAISSSAITNYQNAPPAPISIPVGPQVKQKIKNINQYKSDWDTIASSTQAASDSISTLINVCNNNIAYAQYEQTASTTPNSPGYKTLDNFIKTTAPAVIADAQNALASAEFTDVFDQYNEASSTVIAALAAAQTVQDEASSTDPSNAQNVANDIAAFLSMTPTSKDVSDADAKSQSVMNMVNPATLSINGGKSGYTNNFVFTVPEGSLHLNRPSIDKSIIDGMNLLSTNATAMYVKCSIPYFQPNP